MVYTAGQKLTAASLNMIIPQVFEADATSVINLTTTLQDVTGAEITVTPTQGNSLALVYGVGDFVIDTPLAGHNAQARLFVDGVQQSGFILANAGAQGRSTNSQNWVIPLTSAGNHTFKLQASVSNSSVAARIAGSTRLIIVLYDGLTPA